MMQPYLHTLDPSSAQECVVPSADIDRYAIMAVLR
jgi:hypothetical protein